MYKVIISPSANADLFNALKYYVTRYDLSSPEKKRRKPRSDERGFLVAF